MGKNLTRVGGGMMKTRSFHSFFSKRFTYSLAHCPFLPSDWCPLPEPFFFSKNKLRMSPWFFRNSEAARLMFCFVMKAHWSACDLKPSPLGSSFMFSPLLTRKRPDYTLTPGWKFTWQIVMAKKKLPSFCSFCHGIKNTHILYTPLPINTRINLDGAFAGGSQWIIMARHHIAFFISHRF